MVNLILQLPLWEQTEATLCRIVPRRTLLLGSPYLSPPVPASFLVSLGSTSLINHTNPLLRVCIWGAWPKQPSKKFQGGRLSTCCVRMVTTSYCGHYWGRTGRSRGQVALETQSLKPPRTLCTNPSCFIHLLCVSLADRAQWDRRLWPYLCWTQFSREGPHPWAFSWVSVHLGVFLGNIR